MGVLKLSKPCPVQFDPDQPLSETIDILIANELSFAPVIKDKVLLGILNLATALKWTRANESPKMQGIVQDAMQTKIVPYKEGLKIEEALNEDNFCFPTGDFQDNLDGTIIVKELLTYLTRKITTQNERNQAILESVPNGIIAINAVGDIIMLNKVAYRLLGVDSNVIGRPIKMVFPVSNLTDITETGLTEFGQKLEINGRTIISNRSPIILDDNISGAVAIFQDITELENISHQLASVKQLNLELDTIIESSYDGVMITNQDGKGIRINQSLARLTGLDASNFEGKFISDLFDSGIFQFESITIKALREGRTVTSVQKISTTGKEVLVTGNPIFDTEGKVHRVVSNVRDISELHHLQEELRESELLTTRYQTELSQLILERLKKNKIIVQSPNMMKLFDLAMRAARTDVTVLLLGESGVGKEVLSRVIHNSSSRAVTGSFIQINCGAIPENLLESELFGYEPGAFTGANPKGKLGIFEIANNGTLLLDEIGDLPINLQVKLLRVLQEQEVYRIGSTSPIKLNARIIAATNLNIWERVQEGTFREDLYYRLNVLPIEVPPLRERKEDILPLSLHFIQLYNEKYGVEKRLDPKAIPLLEAYSWPGNVRELQNVLERLMVVTDEELIQSLQVQLQLTKFKTKFNSPITVNELIPIHEARDILEKELINMALDCYPSIRKAAEVLGLDHSTIVRKIAKYGIKR
jgi:PAS domain S-box-containing protein